MTDYSFNKINRENFRAMVNALSRPGSKECIIPVSGSCLLGVASSLLFSEVSYYYEGKEDFSFINTVTSTKYAPVNEADYIFYDYIDKNILKYAKKGTFKEPDFSASIFYKCDSFEGMDIELSGPGIKDHCRTSLPVNDDFIATLTEKNSVLPMGMEVFFISGSCEIMALSRTTNIGVI